MARKHAIRTTIEPGRVLTVDDAELIDLDRQGLVYSSESGEYGKRKWQPEEPVADEPIEPGTVEPIEPGTVEPAETKKKGA